MYRMSGRQQILTVSNLLEIMRILMIPLFVWLYCRLGNHGAAAVVIIFSGIVEITNSFIARKLQMPFGFGKALGIAADKLTLAAVMICLAFRYKLMLISVILFAVKEICMFFGNLKIFLETGFFGGFWWNEKRNKVVLYVVLLLLVLFPGMNVYLANGLSCVSGLLILMSFVSYMRFYILR